MILCDLQKQAFELYLFFICLPDIFTSILDSTRTFLTGSMILWGKRAEFMGKRFLGDEENKARNRNSHLEQSSLPVGATVWP